MMSPPFRRFFAPSEEQKRKGWTQDWPQHWAKHDVLLQAGHAPSAEQQARGWSQNWDAWKSKPDEEVGDEGGRILHYDFTGGAAVRFAKAQASIETEAWEKQQLKAARDVAKAVAFKPPVLLTAPLRSGATIPQLGLGTWKSKPGQVHDAVLYAITQAGYRHIDCAAIYEVFIITSKLWNTDHAAARVEPAVRKCLVQLNLEYLDAFLIHWPITGNRGDVPLSPSTRETWAAMEACVAKGLIRHIGVSNFSVPKMRDIMSYATVPFSICQCEAHPLWRNDKVVQFCANNVHYFTAFSPLGSPDSADIFKRTTLALMDEPLVHDIAARTGKNVGQVLIKWALQQRPSGSVLPKSVSESRIRGNAAVQDWELSAADVAALGALPSQCRMVHGGVFLSSAGPYRTLKNLWDEEE